MMESLRPQQHHAASYTFPDAPNGPLKVADHSPMDVDMASPDVDRDRRATSVYSSMSAEDFEAAETLNSLGNISSPRQAHAPPTHLQTASSWNSEEPEPLLSLVTTQHPYAAVAVNSSLSTYRIVQSWVPGGKWSEQNLGLPFLEAAGRVSGMEGIIRRALQNRRDGLQSNQGQSSTQRTPDVEKGLPDVVSGQHRHRTNSNLSVELLPAYNEGDRSPPYTERQTVHQPGERQSRPGLTHQILISTSGLSIAMSEESLRSLRYCISWLTWANDRLGRAIKSLRDLLERWGEGDTHADPQQGMPIANMVNTSNEGQQSAISAQIAQLRGEVLNTLKQVVGVVSNYAGGALPENARALVHRHLTSLPQRFAQASFNSNNKGENENEAAGSAHRVMVLAQEGLDMMTQVSTVVNDTLKSAESWCEKLGRRHAQNPQQQQQLQNGEKDETPRERSETVRSESDPDVKMEM